MKNISLLAMANLRKAKGQTVSLIALILLSALMLNMWLMLSMDYKQNFDRYHQKLNAEHVVLVVDDESSQMRELLTQTMEKDSRTMEFALDDAMHMVGVFNYNGGEMNSELVFLEKEAALTRSIGKIEIVEDSDIQSGIYMPLLYKSDDIAVGKTIEITIGSNKFSYTVCGFFNSIMAGSHNCILFEIIMTEDKYRELAESGYAPKGTLCAVRIKEKAKSQDYEAMIKNEISSKNPAVRTAGNSYLLVAQSRYISQMICAGIMSAMAFFILLIVLVVVASNIANYVRENMKNLGVLKAVGYTGRQLICSLLLQFLGVTLFAAAAGIGISYGLFPMVNKMMMSQTGIPYVVHFLPVPVLLTLLILGGAVTLVVFFASKRMKKIEPITALRQGVLTHNFRKNHVPLDKTKVSLHIALALKTTCSGVKHNLAVAISILVISLVLVFSALMVENMIVDMTPFLDLIVGERADSCININADSEKEFLQEMKSDSRVEKIYLYHAVEVRHVGGVGLTATICDDFADVNNQNVVFQGRFPKFDNEIAIGAKYAKEKGLEIGNEITLTADAGEAKYIISGLTQISNYLGKDCLLTSAGYARMGELQNRSYYLNLVEEADIDSFNAGVKSTFGNAVNAVLNVAKVVEGGAGVYVTLMVIIVAAVLVLSILVIAFVLYLLVRTMLNNKKQDYGILKALGFTTKQLIMQTAISFMPTIILATVVGLTVCSFIINPLTAVFLNGIGIVKCTFIVPTGLIVYMGIGLILVTFGIACLMSMRIKKIVPRELLTGE